MLRMPRAFGDYIRASWQACGRRVTSA